PGSSGFSKKRAFLNGNRVSESASSGDREACARAPNRVFRLRKRSAQQLVDPLCLAEPASGRGENLCCLPRRSCGWLLLAGRVERATERCSRAGGKGSSEPPHWRHPSCPPCRRSGRTRERLGQGSAQGCASARRSNG